MKMMKRSAVLLAAILAVVSCRFTETPEPAPCLVTRAFSVTAGTPTRSLLPATDDFESRIRCVTLAFYRESGELAASAYADAPTVTARLLSGSTYRVFALANMGDLRASLPATLSQLQTFRYDAGSFPDYADKGMPMAASKTVTVGDDQTETQLSLRRLMAKVSFEVDHSALTEGVEHTGIRHVSVAIRQAARALYPFMEPASMALSTADIFAGEADHDTFLPEQAYDLTSGKLVFYVPENAQGNLLENNTVPWQKVPAQLGMDVARRCTYLEFKAVKDGAQDGVSGDISFRFYLGGDTCTNFDVMGNQRYDVRLNLSWDKLFVEGSWKVTRGEDWTDARTLAITQGDPAEEPETVYLAAGVTDRQLDLRFSRGDGQRVLGARDIGYPYGWSLYIDGVLTSGDNGSFGKGITWTFGSDGADEYLRLSVPSQHGGGDTHTLQLKTGDGQIASSLVTTEVLPPLKIKRYGTIDHVGQRGYMEVTNAPEGSDISWSVQPEGYIRITPCPDGKLLTENIGSNPCTITASCKQTGQKGEYYLHPQKLYMVPNSTLFYASPDGAPVSTSQGEAFRLDCYFDYRVDNVHLMTVQSDYQLTTGVKEIALNLYEELFEDIYHLQETAFLDIRDGKVCVVRLQNGDTAFPQTHGTQLAVLTPRSFATDAYYVISTSGITIKSVNPFKAETELQTLDDEEDAGLAAPWLTSGTGASKSITIPRINADATQAGIWAGIGGVEAEPAFGELFSWDGGTRVTYNFRNTTALSEHRGGPVTLCRRVTNRYSGEQMISAPFATFDCYVLGAICGHLQKNGSGKASVSGVLAGGDYSQTAFADLSGTAFIGTERADGSSVSWSGGSATVATTGEKQIPGAAVYTLSGKSSINWTTACQGFRPGLSLHPVEGLLDEGDGCLSYQTYYKLFLVDEWD